MGLRPKEGQRIQRLHSAVARGLSGLADGDVARRTGDAELLDALNVAIRDGSVVNAGGQPVEDAVVEGLVQEGVHPRLAQADARGSQCLAVASRHRALPAAETLAPIAWL